MTVWTDIAKPSLMSAVTISAGMPMGLLLALTYSESSTMGVATWTDVANASGTSWTNIPNAT